MYWGLFDRKTKKVIALREHELDRKYFEAMAKPDTLIIARDHIGKVLVSTVFLGIVSDCDDPHWFETIVFGTEEEYEPQWRYRTYDEAIVGHWKVVQFVKKGMT